MTEKDIKCEAEAEFNKPVEQLAGRLLLNSKSK